MPFCSHLASSWLCLKSRYNNNTSIGLLSVSYPKLLLLAFSCFYHPGETTASLALGTDFCWYIELIFLSLGLELVCTCWWKRNIWSSLANSETRSMCCTGICNLVALKVWSCAFRALQLMEIWTTQCHETLKTLPPSSSCISVLYFPDRMPVCRSCKDIP